MRRALLVALLTVALVAPALGPATASPQPSPVCPFCGSSFAEAAEERGVNATVARSTAEVRIHENGTATWVVRNRLASGADQFRAEPDGLDTVARSLAEDTYGPPEDPSLVSARMDGDAAVLTYRDPDGATRRAGLLVVDYLHDEGYERWYVVNAERFAIRGPPGSVVTNDPESGRVEPAGSDGADRASPDRTVRPGVTWRGNSTAESWSAPTVGGSPFVVFGPDRSAATRARTTLALALATLPVVERSVRSYLLYQTALFAVSLAAVVAVLRSRPPGGTPERWGGAVALVGALGAVVAAVAAGPRAILGPPLFGAGLGLLAIDPRTRDWLRTPRRQAAGAFGVLGGVFVALAGLNLAFADSWLVAATEALRVAAISFPLAAMLPLGGVLLAGRRRLLPWGALAVVAFAATPAGMVNFADPPSGLGAGLVALFLFALAVLAPVLGTVVLALGRSLAD